MVPSRRAYLTALAATLAGCSSGPGTPATDSPVDPPETPTGSPSPTPTDDPERLPADDPALAWAVRLPKAVEHSPAVDSEAGLVYVGVGENRIGTPTPGDEGTRGGLYALDAADGSLAWSVATDAPVLDELVVHDGRVHAVAGYSSGYTGVDQQVLAYGADGERAWASTPHGKFLRIVAADARRVFVGTGDDALGSGGETLFAVGPDGETAWSREAGDAMAGTVEEGTLFYSVAGVALAAYYVGDGSSRWQVEGEPLGNPVRSVTVAGGLCFTELPDQPDRGYPLVARSIVDGTERWRYDAAPASGENYVPTGVANVPQSVSSTTMENGVVATEHGGTVSSLRAGEEAWTFTADAGVRDGPVVGDGIYVGDVGGTVYALRADDGTVRWRASVPRAPHLQPLADGVLAPTPRREGTATVASFGHDGTERWRYETLRELYPPAVAGNWVYATTADGTVLAFASEE